MKKELLRGTPLWRNREHHDSEWTRLRHGPHAQGLRHTYICLLRISLARYPCSLRLSEHVQPTQYPDIRRGDTRMSRRFGVDIINDQFLVVGIPGSRNDGFLDLAPYRSGNSYNRLNGLRFISGLLGLIGSANKSSSVASSPPLPFAAGIPLPTMASNEATPPLPESFPAMRFPKLGSAETATPEALGGRFVTRCCVRG